MTPKCFDLYDVWSRVENETQLLKFLLFMNLLNQVRRSRISERLKKLEELVPNMDKVMKIHL